MCHCNMDKFIYLAIIISTMIEMKKKNVFIAFKYIMARLRQLSSFLHLIIINNEENVNYKQNIN